MNIQLHNFIEGRASREPEKTALIFKAETLTYGELLEQITSFAGALVEHGMKRNDRIAVFLPKQMEMVVTLFGASMAGCVFVPVNPSLKPKQVAYILKDCNVRFLVTSPDRFKLLEEELSDCPDLEQVVQVGDNYEDFMAKGAGAIFPQGIDADMAAILYTSGSTGMPKGVVLSHRNMVLGAESVASYLKNTSDDIILSVLPLSFDAGLSQLTTAFSVGATVVLMNYLMPRDILRQAAKHSVTGITCVPPLWIQLAELDWPEELKLRYIATTGGRMPVPVTRKIQEKIPHTDIYLMYGLTEAFRSTYLDPKEVDRRPDSMGKAIPNAEIMVVRADGTLCDADEVGELVHRGALVGLGYWNDPERTNERYKPAPGQPAGIPNPEIAVWSGDMVKRDAEGFLYFVGRNDEMIKTSGFRTSPTEVEEGIFASGLIGEVAALGIDDDILGQVIWVVATFKEGADVDAILAYCRAELPGYMVPQKIIEWPQLPRNPNGKVDRKAIKAEVLKEE